MELLFFIGLGLVVYLIFGVSRIALLIIMMTLVGFVRSGWGSLVSIARARLGSSNRACNIYYWTGNI